ncbi:MAG TPA: Gfo/Idh/MocA family oxidoreductase, partial [Gemmatimonadaceae bacterium]|nr:Gfo/Idh/MocA family oxidoreductase [Gemmatimonadaceae bacterium]
RAARQLHESDGVDAVRIVARNPARAEWVANELGARAERAEWPAVVGDVDVLVLAVPEEMQADMARAAVGEGTHVVSTAASIEAVDGIVGLDARARVAARSAVAGVAMSPGLSCLLALHAGRDLDIVEEIHVAKAGTGGPACARATHASLRGPAASWRDGRWQSELAGSGRELCFFPEPVGGLDCYATSSAEAALLTAAFPTARRVTARLAATRRDKATSWLPMLRPPHPEGLIGGVRVEVRGFAGGKAQTHIVGAVDRPAIVAGTLAAMVAVACGNAELRPGAGGLGVLAKDPGELLARLADRGVKVAAFVGS